MYKELFDKVMFQTRYNGILLEIPVSCVMPGAVFLADYLGRGITHTWAAVELDTQLQRLSKAQWVVFSDIKLNLLLLIMYRTWNIVKKIVFMLYKTMPFLKDMFSWSFFF